MSDEVVLDPAEAATPAATAAPSPIAALSLDELLTSTVGEETVVVTVRKNGQRHKRTVIVRELTVSERSTAEMVLVPEIPEGTDEATAAKLTEAHKRKALPLFRAALVKQACFNPDRTKLFKGVKAEQIASLPAAAIEPLVDAVQRLSGFGEKDLESLGNASAATHGSTS